jgi:ubiquinone/menaquinone biosynthesis C-methylase UbiE
MVALIRGGVPNPGGVWADLGAGTGNFTWALAELLGADATVYALDRDGRAIQAQEDRLRANHAPATIIPQQADALQIGSRHVQLPPLDGVLLANLLHFIRDQRGFLGRLLRQIKPGGLLLVVEYEQSFPIPWVPFPVPFQGFVALAEEAGLQSPAQIGVRRSPSSGQAMYAAVATKAGL